MIVLRPKGRLVVRCYSVDDTVRKRQTMARRFQHQRDIQVNDLADLHDTGDLESIIFSAFTENFF